MVDAEYGAIDFDQRGFGQTTGKVRVMDPDFEGKDYLAILDWAQNKLPWLAFGPTLEGDDNHEPIVGGIGGSTVRCGNILCSTSISGTVCAR